MKNLFLSFSLMICMLGSFSLRAQDHITDEQVIEEMNDYLDHLNGDDNSFEKHQYQLELLKSLTLLWKNPDFRELRIQPLDDILKNHLNNPYALLAMAFSPLDIESEIKNNPSPEDPDLLNRALQFRQSLGRKTEYEFHSTLTADDIGFTDVPSQIVYIQRDGLSADPCPSVPFMFIRDLNSNEIVSSQALSDEFIQYVFTSAYDSKLTKHFYMTSRSAYEKSGFGLILWDFTKDEKKAPPLKYPFYAYDVSRNQKFLAWIESGSNIKVQNLTTQEITFIPMIKDDRISAISFNPKESVIALGTESGIILTYDLVTQETKRRRAPVHIRIYEVALDPQNKIVAYTHGASKTIYRMNMDTGETLSPILGGGGSFQSSDIIYSPLGDLMSHTRIFYTAYDSCDSINVVNEQGANLFSKDYYGGGVLDDSSGSQKIEFSSDGVWMAILLENQTVEIYKRTLPILDFNQILLIDPSTGPKPFAPQPSPTAEGEKK